MQVLFPLSKWSINLRWKILFYLIISAGTIATLAPQSRGDVVELELPLTPSLRHHAMDSRTGISDPVLPMETWIVPGGTRASTEKVFKTKRDISGPYGFELVARLIYCSTKNPGKIGRFRLSTTGQDRSDFSEGTPGSTFKPAHWDILIPSRVSINEEGPQATIEKNGTVYIADNRQPCTVTVYFESGTRLLRGFRLEAIADERLPKGGPGTNYNGSFSLTRLEIEALPRISENLAGASGQSHQKISPPQMISLPLRRRIIESKDVFRPADYTDKIVEKSFNPRQTGVVLVDFWDKSGCVSLDKRAGHLTKRINATFRAARQLGMKVFHAPSDTMDAYKNNPQRIAITSMKLLSLPEETKKLKIKTMPWMERSGFCECSAARPCEIKQKGKKILPQREHPSIEIMPEDLIIDCNNTRELWTYCKTKNINTLLFAGVAANKCVQWRACGLQTMSGLGLQCILIRDLSISQSGNGYDPDLEAKNPTLTPERGDAIVVDFFEKFIGPTIASIDIVNSLFSQGPR